MDAVELTVDATTETWEQAMDEQALSDKKTIEDPFTQEYGMPKRAAVVGYIYTALAIGFGIATYVLFEAYEVNKPWVPIPTGCLTVIFTVFATFVLLNAFQYNILGYGLPICLSFLIIGVAVPIYTFNSYRDVAYSFIAISSAIVCFSFYVGISKFQKANAFKLQQAAMNQSREIE
jgi:hypothetical protein